LEKGDRDLRNFINKLIEQLMSDHKIIIDT